MSQTNKNYNPLKKEDYSQGYGDYNLNYYRIPKYRRNTKDNSNARLNQETYKYIQDKNLEKNLINNIKNTLDERYLKRKTPSLFPTPKVNLTFVENYGYKANKSYSINNGEEDSPYVSIGSNNSHRNSRKGPNTSAQEKLQTIQYSDNIKLYKKKEESFNMEKNTRIEEKLDEIKNGLYYFGNKIEKNFENFLNKFKDENEKLLKAQRQEIKAQKKENDKLINAQKEKTQAQREEYQNLIKAQREDNKRFLAYLARLMGIQLNNTQLNMFDFP